MGESTPNSPAAPVQAAAAAQELPELVPSAKKPAPAVSSMKKKSVSPSVKKEPQFEEEAKVHEAEDSPSADEASSASTKIE